MACLALGEKLNALSMFVVYRPDAVNMFPSELNTVWLKMARLSMVLKPCTVLIVDHYEWTQRQDSQCRAWAKCVAIDDLAETDRDANILVNPNAGGSNTLVSSLIMSCICRSGMGATSGRFF